jgi:hypothetical protein
LEEQLMKTLARFSTGAGVFLACLLSGTTQAAIIEVDYFSLTGNVLIDFEDLAGGGAPGTNYDDIIDLDGVSIGERFSGQVLGVSGNSDTLSGAPAGSLSLVAGTANQNLNIFNNGSVGGNVLTGLGPQGFPNFDAIGEGAVALLFDRDQSEFGFESVGGNLGDATFEFWARDGSLLGSLTPTGLGTDFFGFQSDSRNIGGISIWNTDPAGIGFNDVIFDVPGEPVPAPASIALFGLGIVSLAWSRRKKA